MNNLPSAKGKVSYLLTQQQIEQKASVIVALLEGLSVVYGKGRKSTLNSHDETNLLNTIKAIINASS